MIVIVKNDNGKISVEFPESVNKKNRTLQNIRHCWKPS